MNLAKSVAPLSKGPANKMERFDGFEVILWHRFIVERFLSKKESLDDLFVYFENA